MLSIIHGSGASQGDILKYPLGEFPNRNFFDFPQNATTRGQSGLHVAFSKAHANSPRDIGLAVRTNDEWKQKNKN